MPDYRNALPQLSGQPFLTDGGLETTLIFHEGQDLPHFAAFHLMRTAKGEHLLRKYFRTYAALAAKFTAWPLMSARFRATSTRPSSTKSVIPTMLALPLAASAV